LRNPILLVGDPKESELADTLALRFPLCQNLVGKTSLIELVALLKGARFAIGPDSGPAHIAAAVGTYHITLFGPTDPQKAAPWGLEHLVLQSAIGCRGCYRRRCPGLNTACMRLISPQAAAELAIGLPLRSV
jgi:ADP-heptose:LPS heptosyltransferase